MEPMTLLNCLNCTLNCKWPKCVSNRKFPSINLGEKLHSQNNSQWLTRGQQRLLFFLGWGMFMKIPDNNKQGRSAVTLEDRIRIKKLLNLNSVWNIKCNIAGTTKISTENNNPLYKHYGREWQVRKWCETEKHFQISYSQHHSWEYIRNYTLQRTATWRSMNRNTLLWEQSCSAGVLGSLYQEGCFEEKTGRSLLRKTMKELGVFFSQIRETELRQQFCRSHVHS